MNALTPTQDHTCNQRRLNQRRTDMNDPRHVTDNQANGMNHFPAWFRSMPLYRLLVFISMFTAWNLLRIPAF